MNETIQAVTLAVAMLGGAVSPARAEDNSARMPGKEARYVLVSYMSDHPEVLRDVAECYVKENQPYKGWSSQEWLGMSRLLRLAAATRDHDVILSAVVMARHYEQQYGKHPFAALLRRRFPERWAASGWEPLSREESDRLQGVLDDYGIK